MNPDRSSRRRLERVEVGLLVASVLPAPVYLLGCYATLGLLQRWRYQTLETKLEVLALDALYVSVLAFALRALIRGKSSLGLRLLWGVAVALLYLLTPS